MNATRFIGIGDLHLAPGPRNADRLAALDFAINDAIAEAVFGKSISAWLVCGDLNHSRMSIDDRNALIERFEIMADVAEVVVVKGNHDLDDELDFLAHLKTRHRIHVATTSQVLRITLDEHRTVTLFCLPYPSKANIVAAGFAHEDIAKVFQQSMDTIFMEAASQFSAALANGHLTGMVGHITIGGAVASAGQPQIGGEMELTPSHLRRLGDCFQLFGHIHKHQRVDSAVYAGSLCRLDWGETEPKGYVVIDCEQQAHGWSHTETFVPIPVPPMYHIEGVLTRKEFVWRCTKGPGGLLDAPPETRMACPACEGSGQVVQGSCAQCGGVGTIIDWSNCDVRVRYTYASSERELLAEAIKRMERQFDTARRHDFEPIASSDRLVRAPEVVQAATFEDKIKAWAKLMGVSWSDLIALKAQSLESFTDTELLIAATRAQLADFMGDKREPFAKLVIESMPPPVPGGDAPKPAQTDFSMDSVDKNTGLLF